MVASHLLFAVTAAVMSAGGTLAMGQGALTAIGAYALGGAAGLLGSAAIAARRAPARIDDWDDERRGAAAVRRAASAGQVVPIGAAPRASAPELPTDLRLAPDWMLPDTGWPEDLPEDLRLRMLDALSYRGEEPEALWAAMRGWLAENNVGCPSQVRATRRRRASRPRH